MGLIVYSQAATFTWTGTGTNGNWGDITQWSGLSAPPTNGINTDIILEGSDTSPDIQDIFNNDVDYDIDSITLSSSYVSSGGAMFLSGGALTVDTEIVNNDSQELEFNSVVNLGDQTLSIRANNGTIDFDSDVNFQQGGSTIFVTGGGDVFFDSGITGSGFVTNGRLSINNGSFVRISGSSTALGEIDIFDGTFQINSSSNLAAGADLGVFSDGTFDLNNFDTNIDVLTGGGSVDLGSGVLTLGESTAVDPSFTFSGVISGTGGIVKNQTGETVFSGSNTYTGATTVNNGTLRLEGSGRLSNSTDVLVEANGTFDLNGVSDTVDSIAGAGTIRLGGGILTVDETSGTRTFSGDILETGEMQKNGAGTLILSGNNAFSILDINQGELRVSSQANLGSGTVEIGSGTLNTTSSFTNSRNITTNSTTATIEVNNGTTLTQSATISGTGAITKSGNGTFVLNASNTYTGDTNVSDGILRINATNAISNASDVDISAGATLDLNNRSETVNSLSGNSSLSSVDTGGTGGRITVDASSGTFTWSGVISGSGGFTKTGNHTAIIASVQTYTGSTVINDGLVQFSGNGDFSLSSDVSVASGATWDLNGLTDQVDSISGAGSILLGGASLFVDENGGTRTFSGVISEAGSFRKLGTHTMVLSGNNTYTGTTTIDAGVLRIGSSSNLGSGGIIFRGGTLNTTGTLTNSRTVTIDPGLSATFDVNSGTTLVQSGGITGSSTTTINKIGDGIWNKTSADAGTFDGDIFVNEGTFAMSGAGDALGDSTRVTVNSGATFQVFNPENIGSLAGAGSTELFTTLRVGSDGTSTTYSGVISGAGILGKLGSGTFTLTGNNTNTGTTDIDAGILRLSGAGRLNDTSNIDVASGATFDLNGVSDTVDALIGSGSITLGGGTLTVGGGNASGTFTGNITESGAFVKVGLGTQTLSGSNTWDGGTQINGGTLRITGSTSSNLGNGTIQIDGGTLETAATMNNLKGIQLNAGGGTIDVDTGTTFAMFAGTPITGIGSLTKTGNGTLQLSASTNSYGGPTNINDGTLQFINFGQLPDTTDVSIASGATWDLNGNHDTVDSISGAGNILLGGGDLTVDQVGGATIFSGIISETGGLIKDGTHTLILAGANTYTGPTTINEGILSISGNSNLGDSLGDISIDSGTLQITDNVVDLGVGRDITLGSGGGIIRIGDEGGVAANVPGIISGVGSLTIAADNEEFATLSGVNTYQGGTTVQDASLSVSQNANLGANGGAVTLDGGILETTASFTNLHPIVIAGSGAISVNSGTLTQSAGISGTGNLSIQGPGTMILTEPAIHAGNTFISSNATLQFGSGELPDAFDVTAGGVWDLNGVSDTIDGLFGNGTVLLGGGTLTVGDADGDGNFSGSIQETGAFVKTGSGTQVLSGANTYTASTLIDQGTLEITDNSSLGALSSTLEFNQGTLRTTSTFTTGRTTTINSIGEFETAAGTTLTFASPIAGAANADLVKSGAGTLVLTQSNTFGGLTEITEGTLRLTGGGLLANGGVDVFNGATFDVTDVTDTIGRLLGGGDVLLGLGTLTIGADDGSGSYSGVISGVGGAIIKEGTGTQVFTGVSTYTGGTFINDGVLQVSQSENLGSLGTLLSFDGGTLNTTASFGMIRGTQLEAGGGTFDVDDTTTLDASGNITGPGGLTKIGDGTLVLSGFSTYLGGTNVNAGVVEISSAVNLGSTLGTLTLDGGTLRTTGNITTARPAVMGPGNGTFEVVAGTTLTRTGIVSGPGLLIKTGDGDLDLEAANTYLGNTVIGAGTLRVDASNQLGDAGNAVQLTDGTLNTTASFTNARSVLLSPGIGTFNVNTGTTLTQSGSLSNDIPILDGEFTKTGAGVLQLTAANTYTGSTTINAGTVRLSGAGQLPDVTDVSVANGATFDLNNVSDTIDALAGTGDVTLGSGTLTIGANDGGGTFTGVISGSGGLTKVGTGTQLIRTKSVGMDEFPHTYAGNTAINGGILDVEEDESLGDPAGSLSFDGGTLRVQGENSFNTTRVVTLNNGGGTLSTVGEDAAMDLGGVVSGTGSLTKTGIGRLTLSAANTYAGDTIITQGLVRLDGNGRLPDVSTVTVNAATAGLNAGGLDLNDIDDAIDGLNGTGDVVLGTGILTVGSADSGGNFSGTIEGTGGFVKTGAGAQVLSGANTYTGGTSFNGGTLEVNANNNLGAPLGALSFDGGTLIATNTFAMQRTTTLNSGGGTISVTGATTLTKSFPISGTGGLTKADTGTLILGGANSYTGPTNITGGMLRLGAIERLADVTDVTVSAGAIFDLDSNNESIDALSGAGSVQLGSAQLVVGLDNGSGTFGGVLSGTGDLLKEGIGTQTLTGANTYSGATFVDRGELILSGGGSINQTTLVTGFNIGSAGTTTVDGAATTWDLSGNLFVGFDGTGTMNINNGATVMVDGDVTVGGNGIAGVLSLDGGTLDNSAGTGVTVTTGALQGEGTVVGNVFNQDTVAPGNSAGILSLTGNYGQDVTGLLSFEIGGTDNSDPLNPDFDVFDISGTAGLAGELELALINGFTPAPSDMFTVLTSSALAGIFSNVADGARLNIYSGGTGSFQVDYTATSVVLSDFQGTGSSIPGDFDGNQRVDGFDFLAWQRDPSIGTLATWETNYGTTTIVNTAPVPEPSSLIVALTVFAIAASRRRS
ncbi:MAG: autotransporter-associated beta strand repeat-containing protein [Lacipirellulaceae bacterium]